MYRISILNLLEPKTSDRRSGDANMRICEHANMHNPQKTNANGLPSCCRNQKDARGKFEYFDRWCNLMFFVVPHRLDDSSSFLVGNFNASNLILQNMN
jgi:hypothetical protein